MKRNTITIIGAGPAGCVTALYLAEKGYQCTLIEKDVFPREKTCGDALGGYVISVLEQINPQLLAGFMNRVPKIPIQKAHFYSPKLREIIFPTAFRQIVNGPESFIAKRMDFDSFLADEVRKHSNIDFYESVKVASVLRNSETIIIKSSGNNPAFESDLVIFANGGQKIQENNLFSFSKQQEQSAFGIRAYFNNVRWDNDNDSIHLYFLNEILPGYLWIFPSTDGSANVGLAMDMSIIRKKKINLQEVYELIIQNYPTIAKRLKEAKQIGTWKGLHIPLGSRFANISGNNYLITGDAAWLASPLTGEGIGEAMYSGLYAAKQAIKSIDNANYSAEFLKEYDRYVFNKIGKLNKIYTKAQHLIRSPLRANVAFGIMKNRLVLNCLLTRIDSINRSRQQ